MRHLSRIRKLRRHTAPTCREISVNRSQRRAAVVKRTIAAGLLCFGVGSAVAAPALADTGDDAGTAVASNTGRVARGGPVVPAGRPENVSSGTRRGGRVGPPATVVEWHPEPDWCHFIWPDWWVVPPSYYYYRRNIFILPQAPTMASPPTLVAGVVSTGVHASTDLSEAAPGGAEAAAPPAAAGPPDAPAAAPAPAVFGPSAPAGPLAAPAPPPRAPEGVAPPPDRTPARLPDLPSANLGDIAAVALPGLAGIAALTVLGGFLGYRQAKAGYVLRAAGTARFLQ